MPMDSEDFAAIKKQSEQFFAALGRGDVGAVTEMHTDNAVVLPPNRRIIQRADIDAFWRNLAPRFQNIEFTTVGVEPLSKEAAREIGRFRVMPQGEDAEPILSKYLILWQNIEGSWRISSMVWNRRETNRALRSGQP
jgi:ketosteroid isomerase-like protein